MKKTLTLLILSLSIPQMVLAATKYNCSGTEPFWDLNIGTFRIDYRTPGEKGLERERFALTPALGAAGMVKDFVKVYNTVSLTKGVPASITLLKGSCNDGMSDTVYDYHTIFNNNGKVLYGCCSIVKKRHIQ